MNADAKYAAEELAAMLMPDSIAYAVWGTSRERIFQQWQHEDFRRSRRGFDAIFPMAVPAGVLERLMKRLRSDLVVLLYNTLSKEELFTLLPMMKSEAYVKMIRATEVIDVSGKIADYLQPTIEELIEQLVSA